MRWLTFDEAESLIATNRPEKAELLRHAPAQGRRHLDGEELAASRSVR